MSPPKTFTCTACGESFSMPERVLERYPGWQPRLCRRCHGGAKGGKGAGRPQKGNSGSAGQSSPASRRAAAQGHSTPPARSGPSLGHAKLDELPPALRESAQSVLARYTEGPFEGVFTDGGCSGNPGPGGWGAALVRQDILVAQRFGRAPQTTNNRMELTALMAAYEIIDEHAPNEEVVIWSDSQLVVNTLTKWAPAWERNGWRRRGGPVKNLDLVKPLYDLARAHPRATVKWLRGHHGSRWNEYVDMLATAPL